MNIQIVIPVLIGIFAGWLINYLADVLPHIRRFSQPVCLHCQEPLSPGKYLSLGACPSCGKPRSLRTWIVQILAIVVSLLLWPDPYTILGYWLGYLVLVYFGIVFVIDLEHRLILHPVSMVGAVLGLGVGSYLHGFIPALLGGLEGAAIMLAFYWFGTLFARIRARRMLASGQAVDDEEALGAGDVILAGILGLLLSWERIWFSLLLGVLIGGLISVPMFIVTLLIRRRRQDAWMVFIPYGPFLLIGATILLYF